MNDEILCVGEVLWDSLPAGLFLGGAPYNVACHLRQLGRRATPVSRVGDDVLGREALRRAAASGLSTDLVQVDPELPTGFVKVQVDADGIPEYEILRPAAWDAIALDDELKERARQARAVVFGSLAQRQETSRPAVQALAAVCPFTVFDVNLRPPFVSRDIVRTSLHTSDFVKLNAEELRQMSRWFDLPAEQRAAVQSLAEHFDCRLVCVTRGEEGAVLWHEGRWLEHEGYSVAVRDTVGAGDAFLAALLAGVLEGRDDEEVLDLATRLGAYVSSQFGATPAYHVDEPTEITGLAL